MSEVSFGGIVKMPEVVPVLDFTNGPIADIEIPDYAIGRYNEKRPGMYTGDHHNDRYIHMGIDLFVPVGRQVYAAADGEIVMTGNDAVEGGYGYTVIARHELEGRDVYALYGHLARSSLGISFPDKIVNTGSIIGTIGNRSENGNWPPHVHFQLSWVKPEVCDIPGVVSDAQHAEALEQYPDPRKLLGDIY